MLGLSTRCNMKYSRDYYLTSSIKTDRELQVEPMARRLSGVAWNRFIGQYIVDDLHEKLLDTPPDKLLPMLNILTLISCGWLYTAAQLAKAQTVDGTVAAIRDWLVDALQEADNT